MQTVIEKLATLGHAAKAINKAIAAYPDATESEIVEIILASSAQYRENRVVFFSVTRTHEGKAGASIEMPERTKDILGL